MKRTLSLVLALVMIFGTIPAFAAPTVNEAGEFLQDAGVLLGYLDGDLGLGDDLLRQDSVVMLARLLGEEDAAADAEGEPTWEDITISYYVPYLKWAQEEGYYKGHSDANFGFGEVITAQDYALVLLRALGYDVEWADAYEEALELGLLEDDVEEKEEITRGQMALMTYAALETEMAEGDKTLAEELGITMPGPEMAAEVINAKTIEVKFNKAVDKDDVTVELLRGTFKQNVTLKWADDNKSVQLVGANNFQAADYTVKVTMGEEVLTAELKIEAQKVVSIEILDEIAVASKAVLPVGTFDTGTTATVAYVVKDQYGADITKTTSLTTNDISNINVESNNGVVRIGASLVQGKKVGDLVPVVLIHNATGLSATKILKLSDAAAVSSIAVDGIYNAKGEEVALNDKSKATDGYIVLDIKDQYGNKITEAITTGLIITNTNPTVMELVGSPLTAKEKIGDDNEVVVKFADIKKAGSVDIILISTTNGRSVVYTVVIGETALADAVSVSQPEIAVVNEDTLIPITVYDKDGNVITDKKLLASEKGIKVNGTQVGEANLEVKDGQVYYKNKFTASGIQALVFQSATYKVATITIDVKAAAIATLVGGLKEPLLLSKAKGPVTITAKDHLLIEDQYGRVMKDSTAPVKVTLVGTTEVLSLEDNKVTPLKNGTATLKVELVTPNGSIDSAVEVTVRVTDGKEYTDYEIKEIGLTQAGPAKALTVNGVLNGGKVSLLPGEYSLSITGGNLTKIDSLTDGKFTIPVDALDEEDGKLLDTEFTVKVTINATGKVLEQKFIASNAAPKAQSFFFTTAEVASTYADAKSITEAKLQSGKNLNDGLKAGDSNAKVNIATTDQYGGKAVAAISGYNVIIVPEKAAEVTITGNGTSSANATLIDVTEAKATIYLTVGSATVELPVTIVPAP